MSNETHYNDGAAAPGATASASEWRGFCQSCGLALNAQTVRMDGSAALCEPCYTARSVSRTMRGSVPGAPSPVLAGFLGLIPGVGAMYNGQYAKGVAHVVVFIVLSSLSDHVSGAFGLLVAGWFFYQVFDAYHTAKARLMGLPLPNPFGLNDIGERMGFGKNWGTATPFTPAAPAAPASAAGTTGTGWVGYVPPTNFGGAAPYGDPAAATETPVSTPPFTQPATQPFTQPSTQPGAFAHAPYAQTYTGGGYGVPTAAVPPVPVPAQPAPKRFPVGAAWLVGLGLLFLLGEFAPEWGWDWSLTHRWALTVLFAGLGAWALLRRLTAGPVTARGLRPAIFLFTLAILFGLQAAEIVSLVRTWPFLLIVLGGVMLAERAGWGFANSAATAASPVSLTDPAAETAPMRAAWPGSSEAVPGQPKDGQ